MKKAILVVLGLAMLLPMAAMAQTQASGTLTVSATLQSSIYLTLENATGGPTLTNAGSPAATLAFGTVSAYGGTVPTGVTKATVASPAGFSLTTSFGVKVALFNSSSQAYTINAALTTADSTNTWTVDTKALSTTGVAITNGAYGAVVPHTLVLTIPATNNTGSVNNQIALTATAS